MAGVLGRSRLQALLCRCGSGSIRSSEILERPLILCNASPRRMSSGEDTEAKRQAAVRQQLEAAAREDRLDLFAAARILFSTPPKTKKFGLDFHLWQFFVSLLPPFAVYLTAQYARYEMRRMEKEREEAEQLKLRAALAEVLDAQSTDEESKTSNISMLQSDSSTTQPEQTDDYKAKNKDEPVVMLPEKDLLTMKARLDAMEIKVKLLEAVRPGTTFIIPLEGEPNVVRVPAKDNIEKPGLQAADQARGGEELQRKVEKQEIEILLTKGNVEKSALQAADQTKGREGLQRKLESQKGDIPSEERNQEDLEVLQGSGRSWFGFWSKPKERELSDGS